MSASTIPNNSRIGYAGVGSRLTPPTVLEHMSKLAEVLANAGFWLSTGGASGADNAFENGALLARAPVTVHIPWPQYNHYRPGFDLSTNTIVIHPRPTDTIAGLTYQELARRHHPAWHRCSRGARALFTRNVSILAGTTPQGSTPRPIRAVVAFTPNGKSHGRPAGGTGHTLRVAGGLSIPTINLSPKTSRRDNRAALAIVPPAMRDAIIEVFPRLRR